MNQIMFYTVYLTVSITRPKSKTEEEAKKTIFIFLAYFANMSLIPLLVYQTYEVDFSW